MTVFDFPVNSLQGEPFDMSALSGDAILVVNVASKCGFTPQYAGLEQLHEKYRERGFSVLGVPCNQFGEQEPGSASEIAEFCRATYGVSFPMLAKTDVNGSGRHPLYSFLTEYPDSDGIAGDVEWNFEKFLLNPQGSIVGRFRPAVAPEDPALVAAIEAQLPR